MAHINVHLLASLFTGTIGNELTIYERGGKLIVAKKRCASTKKPTAKQLAARERMKAAVNYAKDAMEDAELLRQYQEMAGPGQNAFNMAVQAYFSGESVEIAVTATSQSVRMAGTARGKAVEKAATATGKSMGMPATATGKPLVEKEKKVHRKRLHAPMMVMNFPTLKRGDG